MRRESVSAALFEAECKQESIQMNVWKWFIYLPGVPRVVAETTGPLKKFSPKLTRNANASLEVCCIKIPVSPP